MPMLLVCHDEDWKWTAEFSDVEVAGDFNKGSFDARKSLTGVIKREWDLQGYDEQHGDQS